jgi:hypothetical protein
MSMHTHQTQRARVNQKTGDLVPGINSTAVVLAGFAMNIELVAAGDLPLRTRLDLRQLVAAQLLVLPDLVLVEPGGVLAKDLTLDGTVGIAEFDVQPIFA